MGFWSSIISACSRVADKVKSTCSKVWNGITGKDKFNEAEELHAKIKERYDKAKSNYENSVSSKISSIESKLKAINYHKNNIYNEHFPRFVSLGNRIHNIRVAGSHFEEFFDDKILEIKVQTGVQSKAKLFEIDFNNLSFKDVAFSILTLGFFSRKKAKESLQQVKDEEKRIDEEISKMNSQLGKIDQIVNSIDNVSEFFEELVQNYTHLLNRFEFGINSQRMIQVGLNPNIFTEKLDFKLMPIAHIEEFQSLFNLSIVLKQMSQLGYLSQQGEVSEQDTQQAKILFTQAKEIAA
ncbi:DNA repair protein [Psychromonas sp. L1A2]|uniref:DNA repair protein n=1 Tax=Psychromonas sp. L1A2 TaxID=2686356 RepID=UPI0013568B5C|nr:DNA repair protein [Psychromonas sp. L1A2]